MAEKKTLDLAPFQVDLLLVFWCFMYTTSSTIDSETKIAVPSYSERKSLYVTFCSFGSRTIFVARFPYTVAAKISHTKSILFEKLRPGHILLFLYFILFVSVLTVRPLRQL